MSKAPVIVCTILGILLISSILVLNLTSTTPQMPEDSPERVVQVFLEYVSKDAHNSAYELLSKELKKSAALQNSPLIVMSKKTDTPMLL